MCMPAAQNGLVGTSIGMTVRVLMSLCGTQSPRSDSQCACTHHTLAHAGWRASPVPILVGLSSALSATTINLRDDARGGIERTNDVDLLVVADEQHLAGSE